MSRLNISYVTSPREEFRQYSKSRIEGLAMREQDVTLALYRQAIEEGLAYLSDDEEVSPCD